MKNKSFPTFFKYYDESPCCKTFLFLLVTLGVLLLPSLSFSQDGKIIEKKLYTIPDSIAKIFEPKQMELDLSTVEFYRIVYMSDGLKVVGYVVEPKAKGKYPCIISNRGGNRDFGQWNARSIAVFLARMASWGYVVVASQYRGNEGGEGKEEFGGKELDDVMNLIPVLEQLPQADTSRIAIEGASRGGMMTYLALKRSCRFKAASVNSGMANAFINIKSRPDMDTFVFAELIPNYSVNKDEELKKRSAVFWADQMCKTTPLLIMHGSSDWRVPPEEAFEMLQKLYAAKHPVKFVLFEGAAHGIQEFRKSMFYEIRRHFDFYVRDKYHLPDMSPHGQ